MQQWVRLPDIDAAGTTSGDTTETQVGTGIRVPEWAKSLLAVHFHTTFLTLTTSAETTELAQGYVKVSNDQNTIDPLKFPSPEAVCLTGAIGTHVSPCAVTFPAFSKLTKNDTLRIYSAFDTTQTGAHTWQAYLLLSSDAVPYQLHADMTSLITSGNVANTATAGTNISTIAGKTNGVLGMWGTLMAMATAAESVSGYALISSRAVGWVDQRMPLPVQASGLSTQITPFMMPLVCATKDVLDWCDGYYKLPFPTVFPLTAAENFTVKIYTDGTNTKDPISRVGLIWKE